MDSKEDEHLEFKEANNRFDFEVLVKYCVALANEGGGRMILGVTDKCPRKVVGTKAFDPLERTKAGIIERLHLRVDVEPVSHPDGRVLIFQVPSRYIGMPVQYKGAYWMRGGEDLVPMTGDLLQRIFAEAGPDFSAEVCLNADFADLDPAAIEDFRRRWSHKSKNESLLHLSQEALLRDAELASGSKITYAALVLFGTRSAIGKHLAQAEVVFEYRSSEAAGPAQQREEYRLGFFSFYDELWNKINLRNDKQHFQDGLFMLDVPSFNETAVREAILNAVSHRDYRHAGSTFIRQFQRRLEIVSPGGLPPGITPENILDRQQPRNRRIADAFSKCGLVERAGQGANRIYEACIREGKRLPDFTGTDPYQVALTLHGEVEDPQFLRFLEKIGQERLASFSTHDFLVLDLIHRGQPVPNGLKSRLAPLIEQGVLEQAGKGKHILSRKFHAFLGRKGTYTRKKGLDRETNKALLLKHLEENKVEGARFEEFAQVLPSLSRGQLQRLLLDLRLEEKVHVMGRTRGGRWFSGSGIASKQADAGNE